MSDPKGDKDRKREETKADRPAAPLPSITAPRFERTSGNPAPEVSVTSPATAPELEAEEERTNTETQLDPAAYAATPDKDPDELSSEFQPISGKELDARGRLVKQTPAPPPKDVVPVSRDIVPISRDVVPVPRDDAPPTEVAVPQRRPHKRGAARTVSGDRTDPVVPEAPPPRKVSGKRSEPGRWILNRDGHVDKETSGEVEQGAFDPTVLKAAPSGRPRRIPRAAIAGAGAAALVLLAGVAVWTLRSGQLGGSSAASHSLDAGEQVTRIRITSRPSGAAVKINGLAFGVTPVDRESPFAPEAELEVEVMLRGHRLWTRRFNSGQDISVHAQLRQAR